MLLRRFKFFLVYITSIAIVAIFVSSTIALSPLDNHYDRFINFNLQSNYPHIAANSLITNELLSQLEKENQQQSFSHSVENRWVKFYTIARALLNQNIGAEAQAVEFIHTQDMLVLVEKMKLYLGIYYFKQQNIDRSIYFLENVSLSQISNNHIALIKFYLAYNYFLKQDFAKASIYFEVLQQIEADYLFMPDVHYYYAFLQLYLYKNDHKAFISFLKIDKDPFYKNIVPYYIAYYLYKENKYDECVKYISPVIQDTQFIFKPEVLQLLSYIYFQNNQYAMCIQRLTDYQQYHSLSTINAYQLGYSYYKIDSLDKAITYLQPLSNDAKYKDNVLRSLAYVYSKKNNNTMAIACLEQILDTTNFSIKDSTYWNNYITLLFTEKKYQKIIQLQPVILNKLSSSNYALLQYVVLSHLNLKNYTDAHYLYRKHYFKLSKMPRVLVSAILFHQAQVYYKKQLYDSSYNLLKEIINGEDKRSVYFYHSNFYFGEILFSQKKYVESIIYWNKALSMPNTLYDSTINNMSITYNIGYAYFIQSQYQSALSFFDLVVPTYITPILSLLEQAICLRYADCLFMLKEYNKALTIYDKAINADFKDADYAYYQSVIIKSINQPTAKARYLQEFIKKYPNSVYKHKVKNDIAVSLLADERIDESIEYFKSIINTPDAKYLHADALLNLGIAYFNQDSTQETIQYLSLLAKTFPETQQANQAIEFLKDVYIKTGEIKKYFQWLADIGKSPTSQYADSVSFLLSEISYKNKQYDKAKLFIDNYLLDFSDGKYRDKGFFYLSTIYTEEKNYQNALIVYDSLIKRNAPKYYEQSLLKAGHLCLYFLKQNITALSYFEQAYNNPTATENAKVISIKNIINICYKLNDIDKGIVYALPIYEPTMNNYEKQLMYFFLAKKAYLDKQYLDAIKHYEHILTFTQTELNFIAMFEIVNMYFLNNDYQKAEEIALKFINQNKKTTEQWRVKMYLILGDIYAKQKDYFNARETYVSIIQNTSLQDMKQEAMIKNQLIKEMELEERKADSLKKIAYKNAVADSSRLRLNVLPTTIDSTNKKTKK